MTKKETVINLSVDAGLWESVVDLAKRNGVSGAFAVRRALIYMITTGHIFWPTDNEKTVLSKPGTPTPLYDPQPAARGAGNGRKDPVSRSQKALDEK